MADGQRDVWSKGDHRFGEPLRAPSLAMALEDAVNALWSDVETGGIDLQPTPNEPDVYWVALDPLAQSYLHRALPHRRS